MSTMKLKMLTGMAGAEFVYVPGQEVTLETELAKRLIKAGAATEIFAGEKRPQPKPQIETVEVPDEGNETPAVKPAPRGRKKA